MYFQNTIIEKVYIKAEDLKSYNKNNINSHIKNIITDKFGNKCQKYGLLLKDSIKIINRSIGQFNDGHLNSSISMNIVFEAKICNPSEGTIIQCTAISSNKMGILASIGDSINESPLIILLARQHHIDNKYFKAIKDGKNIYVCVIGKKYDLNDRQISIVAKLSNVNEFNKQNNIQNEFLESEEELESDNESQEESDDDKIFDDGLVIDEPNIETSKLEEEDEDEDEDEEEEDDDEEYLNIDDDDDDDEQLIVNDSEEEEEDEDM